MSTTENSEIINWSQLSDLRVPVFGLWVHSTNVAKVFLHYWIISCIFWYVAKGILQIKYIRREDRAIVSWRHVVNFEFLTKVYSRKGNIQSIYSSFGANREGNEGKLGISSDAPPFLRQRTHFRAKLYLFTFTDKNPIAPFSPYYICYKYT